ncbi:MAG: hypothetical protein U0401_09815 [Anaerolineae bacterium]
MELSEILYQYNNDILMKLAGLCGCSGAKRKDELVRCIHRAVMSPASLRGLWHQLDELSQKAVASAYHNDGEFNRAAFVAQYGSLPPRPKGRWDWDVKPILLDLFLYTPNAYHFSGYYQSPHVLRLPTDLMPLLAELAPPLEKFQVTGVTQAPKTVLAYGRKEVPLLCAETEQAGLHDLAVCLRLIHERKVPTDYTSGRANLTGIKHITAHLLNGDFFPLPEKYRANQTIRPFGLDVFARESGLVFKGDLSEDGRQFYQTQQAELLLPAFEKWTQEGSFDELSRVTGVKGQRSRNTFLTDPAKRREAVIEALSWCPAGVWIDLEDFYRAVKIWRFDFEVETVSYSSLYVGNSKDYGALHGDSYWPVVKGSYIKAVLWEYLGSLGALDLLYTAPEEALRPKDVPYFDDIFSPYDGLRYFRINNLGAYLLGQVADYVPAKPLPPALFAIHADLRVTLLNPAELTPNHRSTLEQMAVPVNGTEYHLDTQRLLSTLETGGDLDHLFSFLQRWHSGPLPAEVLAWLERLRQNSRVFSEGGRAIFIKAQSPELVAMILADPVLKKFCTAVDKKTLVIPAAKEKALRVRLKELEYILQ